MCAWRMLSVVGKMIRRLSRMISYSSNGSELHDALTHKPLPSPLSASALQIASTSALCLPIHEEKATNKMAQTNRCRRAQVVKEGVFRKNPTLDEGKNRRERWSWWWLRRNVERQRHHHNAARFAMAMSSSSFDATAMRLAHRNPSIGLTPCLVHIEKGRCFGSESESASTISGSEATSTAVIWRLFCCVVNQPTQTVASTIVDRV
ncbi:hypothetical protein SCHPADRAFT_725832 [Schizopora paradoxa]|uniref:Uncharacterized protein n=1 Tax=Schizopora paradoxa TaxID=27342 RepID=A0A0H2R119_9AGAM|nr:hypothetical protein SCHPADRAFT_725832 [Schizopora paradoxa]